MAEKTLYLVTVFGDQHGNKPEVERIVNATTRSKATQHIMGINKASAADIVRVGSEKIEQASE